MNVTKEELLKQHNFIGINALYTDIFNLRVVTNAVLDSGYIELCQDCG